MKFEVIGPDGKVKFHTQDVENIPQQHLLVMEGQGYTFQVDGKKVAAKGVMKAAKIAAAKKSAPKPATEAPAAAEVKVPEADPREFLTVSKGAASQGPYIVIWNLCKRSKSFDDTTEKRQEFDDLEAASAFLDEKASKAGKSYWAGGTIQDKDGTGVRVLLPHKEG